ncbi:MAG TPA: radical SAM protein [Flavitalea sp.]|nr:radical SAM protein [Flavitalea sp.]
MTSRLFNIYQRYRTLKTSVITTLPVVILMPHSACNCRCKMCDIWKGNKNTKQLTEKDVAGLLNSLVKFGTRQVVLSGGEALMNIQFFSLCKLLRSRNIRITLLTTGLLLKKHASDIILYVDDIIISLDGDAEHHDLIRSVPGGFSKMQEGIDAIRCIQSAFPITARSVIHRYNFRIWPAIIDTAWNLGVDQISFLPADISSQAFNRETPWDTKKQMDILIREEELPELQKIIDYLLNNYASDFKAGFIAETPARIASFYQYYAAHHNLAIFPFRRCNAPWVSTVIEADGSVRPCFFHEKLGNIHSTTLDNILNSKEAIRFRRSLNMNTNPTCRKCVCSLYLSPVTRLT